MPLETIFINTLKCSNSLAEVQPVEKYARGYGRRIYNGMRLVYKLVEVWKRVRQFLTYAS